MKRIGRNQLFAAILLTLLSSVPPAGAQQGESGLIKQSHYKIVARYASEYLSDPASRQVFADVFAATVSQYFILDVRTPPEYAAGHIPGAVNIPFHEVATAGNLAALPPDTPIMVVCSNGQTAGQVIAILNMLGYDAWSLRFGMMAWRSTTQMKIWSTSVSPQTIYGAGYAEETN